MSPIDPYFLSSTKPKYKSTWAKSANFEAVIQIKTPKKRARTRRIAGQETKFK